MGKGAWRRPRKVDYEKFEEAWDKIFGEGSCPDLEQMQEPATCYRPSPVPSAEGSEDEPVAGN